MGGVAMTTISENEKILSVEGEESTFMPSKDPAHLRIISKNILMQCMKESDERPVGLFAAYKKMDADIFSLQEADALWSREHNLNVKLGEMGYALVPMNAKDRYPDREDIQNCNPIYYNTNTFDMVDSGYSEYDISMLTDGKYNPRWYSWVCLKQKITAKQLIVINTHFIWKLTDKSITPEVNVQRSDRYRCESAKQILALAKALQEKYPNTPVITTGDYNSNCESEPYAILKTGLISSRDVLS